MAEGFQALDVVAGQAFRLEAVMSYDLYSYQSLFETSNSEEAQKFALSLETAIPRSDD